MTYWQDMTEEELRAEYATLSDALGERELEARDARTKAREAVRDARSCWAKRRAHDLLRHASALEARAESVQLALLGVIGECARRDLPCPEDAPESRT